MAVGPKFPDPEVKREFYKVVREYTFWLPFYFFLASFMLSFGLVLYNPEYFKGVQFIGFLIFSLKFVFMIMSVSLVGGWSIAFSRFFRLGRNWDILFYGALYVGLGYLAVIVLFGVGDGTLGKRGVMSDVFALAGSCIFAYLGALMQLVFLVFGLRIFGSSPPGIGGKD